jgi:hypothetical protein
VAFILALLRAPFPFLILLLLIRFSSCLPWLLSSSNTRQQLLVILWPALLTKVLARKVLRVLAHAHAHVVLPGAAHVTCDPGFTRVFVLFCGAADATYDLFFRHFGFLHGGLLPPLFATSFWDFDMLVQLL